MKKTLVAIAALVVSLNTFGQGQVHFENRDLGTTPPIDEKITRTDGVQDFTGFTAELFVSTGGTLVSSGTAPFDLRSTRIGYFIPTDLVVPGVPSGTATFVVQAYNGANYATSTIRGQSTPFQNSVAGLPNTPADFTGFVGHAFTVAPVPEPTTLALGAVGLGALLLRRRK